MSFKAMYSGELSYILSLSVYSDLGGVLQEASSTRCCSLIGDGDLPNGDMDLISNEGSSSELLNFSSSSSKDKSWKEKFEDSVDVFMVSVILNVDQPGSGNFNYLLLFVFFYFPTCKPTIQIDMINLET